MTGRVVMVHVLAEFPCSRCGATLRRLCNARVVGGLVSDTCEPYAGDKDQLVCNGCMAKDRDRERQQLKAQAERRKWVDKARVGKARTTNPAGRKPA